MKVMLYTWNPEYWDWPENISQKLLEGESFIVSWDSSNTHVKKGDRVFVVRVGDEAAGIVASGYINEDGVHLDENVKGKLTTHAYLSFEYVVKDVDNPLTTIELSAAFPEQQWCPRRAGIEIKNADPTELERLWLKRVLEDLR